MSVRSPDMLLRQEQHKLMSHRLDNYMFALGVGSIISMLSITLGLFLIS